MKVELGDILSRISDLESEIKGYKIALELKENRIQKQQEQIEILKFSIECCLEDGYLRDRSYLATNPPQNAAVNDIQFILKEGLLKFKEIKE